jgi:hypothetical protein
MKVKVHFDGESRGLELPDHEFLLFLDKFKKVAEECIFS